MSVKPELTGLTSEEREALRVAAVLRERYAPPDSWRCPVCGGPMEVVRVGGGEASKYACARIDLKYSDWNSHFQRSVRWESGPGDQDVVWLADFVLATAHKRSGSVPKP